MDNSRTLSLITSKPLRAGDVIRVIAPSRSMSILSNDIIEAAKARLQRLGFNITFGKHVREASPLGSCSIASRVADLHEAFEDDGVSAIMSAIGGFSSHQLLPHIDFKLIRANPKPLCGFSDVTALQNGILARAGLVTFSGPHFSTFAMKKGFEYTENYFVKAMMSRDPVGLKPVQDWSDDEWYRDQENRDFKENEGYWVINEGEAQGRIVGGNLGTFQLLFGTKFMPDLEGVVAFLEDDAFTQDDAVMFERGLHALMMQPSADKIRGFVIGRFQVATRMSFDKLSTILKPLVQQLEIPVIANVDFGHTSPIVTLPIGGTAILSARTGAVSLRVEQRSVGSGRA